MNSHEKRTEQASQWISEHLPFDLGVADAILDLDRRIKELEWIEAVKLGKQEQRIVQMQMLLEEVKEPINDYDGECLYCDGYYLMSEPWGVKHEDDCWWLQVQRVLGKEP